MNAEYYVLYQYQYTFALDNVDDGIIIGIFELVLQVQGINFIRQLFVLTLDDVFHVFGHAVVPQQAQMIEFMEHLMMELFPDVGFFPFGAGHKAANVDCSVAVAFQQGRRRSGELCVHELLRRSHSGAVQAVDVHPGRGHILDQVFGILPNHSAVRLVESQVEILQVFHGDVEFRRLHEDFVRLPVAGRGHQKGQTRVRPLLEPQRGRLDQPRVQIVADGEDLHGPDGARPDTGHGDERFDVFVFPGLGLVIEEVEGHGGAHRVHDEDDLPPAVLLVSTLNQLFQVIQIFSEFVWEM